jgi:subtilisin family serine protease
MALARMAAYRRPALICAAVAAMAVGATAYGGLAQAAPQTATGTDVYIVQVAGAPIASYVGDEPGYAATKPAAGEKVDTASAAAAAYRAHLKDGRNDVLRRASLGSRAAVYNYDVVLNGFAMRLTAAEAIRLQHTSGVLHVWPSETFITDTISTPAFLGLDGTGGVWDKQFGSPAHAGEGVIVGVLDTGFWPESPSFAPLPEPRPDARVIAKKWHGTCDHGSDPNPANRVTCNNKVIGARFYDAGGLSSSVPDEFLSPRDRNSHGSHTASTAAGDHGANAVINGVSIGSASGMAPAARLAIYKIGWQQPDGTASGSSADIAAAINDAASDGVDVINLSFSGSQTLIVDPVELAFMFAADAGVFVATSAGNSGPTAGTVAHNSPWLTTVAASTHDRSFTRTATLGNGATYSGPGVGTAVASSPLVSAADVALPGVSTTAARLCFSDADPATAGVQPALDPVKVAGKIVACDRGTNARTDKSLAVHNAGGVGMILMNTSPNSLNADFHFVPTIHVSEVDRTAILAYITSAGAAATASLSAATQVKVEAPAMAAFSSNGPALAGNGDLLKPDITAPGVDVIAAVSPPGDNGNSYDALSGTSMSSPHIAGIAALLIGKHPGWSPMAIKSALMTTASQTDNVGKPIVGPDGVANATPLNFGSGHVTPAPAFDPGLVYDSSLTDWIRYGCGLGQMQLVFAASVCNRLGSINASNLNYPTLAAGSLAGTQTLTRTVTNVAGRAGIYDAQVQAPPGTTVTVSPKHLVIPPRRTVSFTVKITRTTAALGAYTFGSLTWVEKGDDHNRADGKNHDDGSHNHSVRSNIAVRPVAVAAPLEISLTGTSGSSAVPLTAGYTGTLATTPHGLAADADTAVGLTGTSSNFNSAAPAAGPAVAKVTVDVPAGSRLARFATFDADYGTGMDVDVYVYKAGTATLVGSSAGGTAQESVTLTAAGTYDIYVVVFAQSGGANGAVTVHQHAFVVPTAATSLTATPASQSVSTAVRATVTVGWSGLTAGIRYLGVLDYSDGSAPIGSTIVAVTG